MTKKDRVKEILRVLGVKPGFELEKALMKMSLDALILLHIAINRLAVGTDSSISAFLDEFLI